jgi:hypothetical protein
MFLVVLLALLVLPKKTLLQTANCNANTVGEAWSGGEEQNEN